MRTESSRRAASVGVPLSCASSHSRARCWRRAPTRSAREPTPRSTRSRSGGWSASSTCSTRPTFPACARSCPRARAATRERDIRQTEYLAAPAIVQSYQVQDLSAARNGNVLVARYNVDSTINRQQQSTDPAPRLSVFVKGPKGWQIVAHANFNSLVGEPTTTTTSTS